MRKTRQLGRYQVADRIAHGGMAEIFRGFTFDLDGFRRDVAIKKILPNYAADKHFVDMLTDEYRLVSCLKHPNVAEVYELVELDDSIIISMEFVDGKDLRAVIEQAKARGQALEFDDIAYLLARALDGLNYAHVAQDQDGQPLRLVHRDFSPSNILIAYDGRVKICDFGVAKAEQNRVQTRTGIIKGKVKYMSPEQAFGKKLDGRSDVFSAGSVLYELATGVSAFSAGTEIDLIFAVRDANPRPCLELNQHIPPLLVEVIEKAMSRSRSGRYQSALEFRDGLLAFLRDYNPEYRRTKLARTMKRLFSDEIDRELRAMEDLIVDMAPFAGDLGRNLIADALGEDAAYKAFSPSPTNIGRAPLAPVPTEAVLGAVPQSRRLAPRPKADEYDPFAGLTGTQPNGDSGEDFEMKTSDFEMHTEVSPEAHPPIPRRR